MGTLNIQFSIFGFSLQAAQARTQSAKHTRFQESND